MLIRYLAVIAFLMAMLPLSLPTAMAAKHAWPTCENFLNQNDAQAAYNADPSDPFKLASKSAAGVPCQGDVAFGTQPLIGCDALADFPNAQAALQGLLDQTAGAGDAYSLDPDGNGTACDQASGQGGDAETLDAAQSVTPVDATPTSTGQPDTGKARKVKNGDNSTASSDTGTTSSAPPPSGTNSSHPTPSVVTGNDQVVITSTGGGSGGDESLGARLEARFADLEAQFAAFSGDDDTTPSGGQRSPVVVSTSPPATTTSGSTSSSPSTTSTSSTGTGTGTATALHHGHHHKGHGKGHGKNHQSHGKGHGHNKKGHKHH